MDNRLVFEITAFGVILMVLMVVLGLLLFRILDWYLTPVDSEEDRR